MPTPSSALASSRSKHGELDRVRQQRKPYRKRDGTSKGINILRLYDDSESTRMLHDLEQSVTTLTADQTSLQGPFSVFKANVDKAIAAIEDCVDKQQDGDSHMDENPAEHDEGTAVANEQALADLQLTLYSAIPSQPMLRILEAPQSAKPRVEELFSHYMLQVADVIQVIGHPHNMFRSVYAQYAMQLLAQPTSSTLPQATFSSHKAIFCAIISTAAFHLRSLNSFEHERWELYNQIGMAYRLRALQYMRRAIMEPFVDAETHCAKLSAILTLVDLDVMEGSSTDFFAHLRGCHQARRLRLENSVFVDSSQPRVRQLEINSIFMDTIAMTTASSRTGRWHFGTYSDRPVLLDTPFSGEDTFLEHTYGVTSSIASMVYSINKIWLYTSGRTRIGPLTPQETEYSLASLAEQLESWSPSTELYASVLGDESVNSSLLESLSTSFYYAARIYFHSCFRFNDVRQDMMPARLSDLTLMAYEQSELARMPASKGGAPLSWPAFVAACEAPSHLRERWTHYWQSLLRHGLGTQQAAWQVVQEVWKTKDAEREEHFNDRNKKRVLARFTSFDVIEPSWTSVVRDSGATIFAW